MMLRLVLYLLVIVSQRVLSSAYADDLVIRLPDGPIQGATYTTPNNKKYFGFRGIPFAIPPTGNLRFEAPQPPQSWSQILDATKDSKGCISSYNLLLHNVESEDCLYVNVYTPSLKPAESLPVMFWIYGGGFTTGSSAKLMYGPDLLIEEDVIVVTSNYRLGAFGFLSTADAAIRGNAGLKDQNLALKWTHDNIAFFGGDPNKIVIFGQSAGAHSSGHHLLSKKSAGLFRGAIVESGSATVTHAIHMDPKSYAFLLADSIPGGTYGNDTQKLKEFLLGQTVDVIVNATNSLPADQQVWPVVEVDSDDAFLSEYPYQLLHSGRFNQVPIIIGICAEESLMFLKDLETAKEMALLYDSAPSNIIPTNLRSNATDNDAIIEKIKDIYLTGSKLFSEDLVALAEGRASVPAFIDGAEKATHSAEIPFIFHTMGSGDSEPANLLTQNRMIKLWTNFAKFLNPTPEKSELFNNITWKPVTPKDQPFLNINGTLELRSNLRPKTYSGWNEIFETYGGKPFITY